LDEEVSSGGSMSGYYVTRIRLEAQDFPGQMQLFTALKRPIYFRNVAIDYIQSGGWAELPKGHYEAFIKALKEGYVRGERSWHLDYHNFTAKWRIPNWVAEEIAAYNTGTETARLQGYVARSKELLDQDIIRPFTNNPQYVPPQLIEYTIDRLKKSKPENQIPDFYAMIYSNLEARPNKDVAHRTFELLSAKMVNNYKYGQIDILNGLSKMNPNDRTDFLSWMFKSPKHLNQVKESNWIVSDIIMDAVLQGEVWYEAKSNENKGTVPEAARPQESATEVLSTPQ
jgi:hypothetical protein